MSGGSQPGGYQPPSSQVLNATSRGGVQAGTGMMLAGRYGLLRNPNQSPSQPAAPSVQPSAPIPQQQAPAMQNLEPMQMFQQYQNSMQTGQPNQFQAMQQSPFQQQPARGFK